MADVNFNRANGAQFATVKIEVSTGKGESKKTETREVEVPRTLADAVKAEGEQAVFKRYIGSLVINLQAGFRNEMKPEGEKTERKRANYLETLGI